MIKLLSHTAVLLICTAALAQEAREVADKVLPSVAMLVMKDINDEPIAIGSGFVVQPGMLVTNSHVIREASSGTATFTADKTEHVIEGVVAFDARHDLALLKIADDKVKSLPVGDVSAVKGDIVKSCG
jgi:S1-C subfamily serine protease